ILRTNAELSLAKPRSVEEYRETIAACLRAAQRMAGLVDGLPVLARADAGADLVRREPVRLDQLVNDTVESLRPLAAASRVTITTKMDEDEVTGDPGGLG